MTTLYKRIFFYQPKSVQHNAETGWTLKALKYLPSSGIIRLLMAELERVFLQQQYLIILSFNRFSSNENWWLSPLWSSPMVSVLASKELQRFFCFISLVILSIINTIMKYQKNILLLKCQPSLRDIYHNWTSLTTYKYTKYVEPVI